MNDARVYDARGNGGGFICPNLTGDHQNRVTDYTAIIVRKHETDINRQRTALSNHNEGDIKQP